jgi:hypothetical protein
MYSLDGLFELKLAGDAVCLALLSSLNAKGGAPEYASNVQAANTLVTRTTAIATRALRERAKPRQLVLPGFFLDIVPPSPKTGRASYHPVGEPASSPAGEA